MIRAVVDGVIPYVNAISFLPSADRYELNVQIINILFSLLNNEII